VTKPFLHELDAYLTGEHANPDAVEDAMFDAPDDPDLALFDRIVRHGSTLVDHGTWDMGCLPEHLDTLRARGYKVQLEERWPGVVRVDVDATADFVCTKLHVGRTDLERVDVEFVMSAFGVTKTIRDVLVDQRDGTIYGLCERPLALIAYGSPGTTRTTIRERGGERRILAEYMFNA
jgi:hypothetical protein